MNNKEIKTRKFKRIRQLLINVKHGLRNGQVQRKDRERYQEMLQDAIDIIERLSITSSDKGHFIVLIEDFLDGYAKMHSDLDRYGILEYLLMDQMLSKFHSWSDREKEEFARTLGKKRWNKFLDGLDQIADLDELGLQRIE